MTRNQIEYQKSLEERRTNLANEQLKGRELTERERSNKVVEAETNRANLAREVENFRSNQARELENSVHNRRTESIQAYEAAERERNNRALEKLRGGELTETMRHNLAGEVENRRANVARETETKRSNEAKERETQRHNTQEEETEVYKANNQFLTLTGEQDLAKRRLEQDARQKELDRQIALEVAKINKEGRIESTIINQVGGGIRDVINNAHRSIQSFVQLTGQKGAK